MASECKQLTTLYLGHCTNITDAAVVAVASGCKQLTTLKLFKCSNITDDAVVALSQDFFFLPLRILFSIFIYFSSHALDFSHIFPQMCI